MTDTRQEDVREALKLAEDVLSHAPFSTQIWPNGMHPNRGIEIIRKALAAQTGEPVTWRKIESAPKDGTPIELWHNTWNCPVSARYRRNGAFCWTEVTLTTQWPMEAFTHWRPASPLPQPDTSRKMVPEIPFDPTNHHNALGCPYCNPKGLKFAPIDALTTAHKTERAKFDRMKKEIGHVERDIGWQSGRVSGLALAIEIANSSPPDTAPVAGEREAEMKSAPAATIGDILSEPRPPASAAMGHSAGADTTAPSPLSTGEPTREQLFGVLRAARTALKNRDQSEFEVKVLGGIEWAMHGLDGNFASQPPATEQIRREVIEKIIKKMIRSGELSEYRTYDDCGLEVGEYVDLICKVSALALLQTESKA